MEPRFVARQIATSYFGAFYEVRILQVSDDPHVACRGILSVDGAITPHSPGDGTTPGGCRKRAEAMELARAREKYGAAVEATGNTLEWRTYPNG